MRTNRFAAFIIASTIAMGAALPAQADVSRTMDQLRVQQRADTSRSPCARSFANKDCATYQSEVIRSVEAKASASAKPVSMHEISGRQLDALLATLN